MIHACPVKGATCPCCGKTPFELPFYDRITSDWRSATCPGPNPLEPAAAKAVKGSTPTLVILDEVPW